MEKEKLKNVHNRLGLTLKLQEKRGITLIALIITIIVLLIIAGICIAALTGDNGIINHTSSAKRKTIHASVYETLNLEAQTYVLDKEGEYIPEETTLIDYLKNEGIIDENNVVDVKKLLSEKEVLGNGTYETGDVYVIEEVTETTEPESNPIEEIEKEYKLIYYPLKKEEKELIGYLMDYIDSEIIVGEEEGKEDKEDKEDDLDIQDWVWTVNADNTITINQYKGKDTEIIVPNVIEGKPVKDIEGTGVNGSIWHESICDIGEKISNVNNTQKTITKIIIPTGIKTIGESSFAYSAALQEVIIGKDVSTIGNYAFCCCICLGKVNIPDKVTEIGNYTFYYTNLSEIDIPNGVTTIGKSAFERSKLSKVNISNSVRTIGESAFYYTNLSEIDIPNGVTTIGRYAFCGCTQLEKVNIPKSVTNIEEYAFSGLKNGAIVTCDFAKRPSGWSYDWYGYYNGYTINWVGTETP